MIFNENYKINDKYIDFGICVKNKDHFYLDFKFKFLKN